MQTDALKQYDYIIAGAGAAGLSLLMHLLEQPALSHKKILVIDKAPKTTNDRTWCFWERQPGLFEPVVYCSWQQLNFYSNYHSSLLHFFPYSYKMIRGIDFYNYVMTKAAVLPNVTFKYGNIEAVESEPDKACVTINGEKIAAGYIFNSIQFTKPVVPAGKYYLLQHFKGWMIETRQPAFNPAQPTLMDFRVSQSEGTTFVYVLPVSAQKALVEYTLFSKNVLPQAKYDEALKSYIKDYLKIAAYTVNEEEYGIIPMTNIKFDKGIGRIINIGTAGGQTKASSGYTFRFIQKQSGAIVDCLLKSGRPYVPESFAKNRFQLYDSTLLNILHNNKLGGDKIFSDLFKKNEASRVLRFLDNESNLSDEIKIMASVPSLVFAKAALHEIVSRF